MLIRKAAYSIIIIGFSGIRLEFVQDKPYFSRRCVVSELEEGAPGGSSKIQLDAVYLQASSS